jgi:hypothetical protein
MLLNHDVARMTLPTPGTTGILAAGADYSLLVLVLIALCVLAVVSLLERRRMSKSSRNTHPQPQPQPRPQVIGEARTIQWRQDTTGSPPYQKSTGVCTFRIERFDEQGNSLRPLMIEIRSESGFTGDLSEGDRVSLYEKKQASPNGGYVVHAVRNLNTGGVFGTKSEVDHGLIDVPPAG